MQVFISIAIILGDGLYNFVKVLIRSTAAFISMMKKNSTLPVSNNGSPITEAVSFDDERRTELFLKDQIPRSVAYGGYVAVAAISIGTLPQVFPQLKWYYILVACVFAPVLAFCNAYGTGVAETNFSAQYNKLVILLFASWIGARNGGIVGSLVICGVVSAVVSTASDFKTGYLTLTSPRATLLSQVIGTAMGCVVNPLVFTVFHHFYESNGKKAVYEAPMPMAKVYRAIAVLGAGDHELPEHCLAISVALFALALAVSAVRELATHNKWPAQHYIPSVTGMAVSFLLVPARSLVYYFPQGHSDAWAGTFDASSRVRRY